MIASARVSMAAVKRFAQKAEEVRDYSSHFESGADCIDDMQSNLHSSASSLRGTVAAMQSVKSRVAATMKQCEMEIGWLTNKINDLRQKGANENEIQAVETELQSWRERLERTKAVNGKILAHIETANRVIEQLETNENTCSQLKEELRTLASRNTRIGDRACAGLKKVEEAVNGYLQIKIKVT